MTFVLVSAKIRANFPFWTISYFDSFLKKKRNEAKMIHIKTQIQIRSFHFLFLSYWVECWVMLIFYQFCLQLCWTWDSSAVWIWSPLISRAGVALPREGDWVWFTCAVKFLQARLSYWPAVFLPMNIIYMFVYLLKHACFQIHPENLF